MKTRKFVIGKYINKSTYVLYDDNNEEFKIIREGKKFFIGNQMRPFIPVKIPKKNGNGTILMCRKYGNGGNIIEEFPLFHNKYGLWALTSGAARNGVFHSCHKPKSKIEKRLVSMGLSPNIVKKVDNIDIELEIGGQLCHHCIEKHGYDCATDGKVIELTEPEYAPEDHFNQYHRGCMVSTYTVRVYDANYIIYYNIGTYMNSVVYNNIQHILIKNDIEDVKINDLLDKLEKIYYR